MRTLPEIARDLDDSGKAYARAQTHYCTDGSFAQISDRHFDLLAEYNTVAKALALPMAHELSPDQWEAQIGADTTPGDEVSDPRD